MIRNLKTLGLALVAVLALTAVVASAASAANYTASTYPTTGTGESAVGNDVFHTEAGNVECKSHYEGTLKEASSDLTVTAHYTECKAFGFLSATVSDCHYTFTAPEGSGDNYTAKIDIVGAACTISAGTCKTEVLNQGPLSSVSLTNNTTSGDMSVQAKVTGIAYKVTEDGFGCGFNGTGEKFGATYEQLKPVTFSATNGAKIDIG